MTLGEGQDQKAQLDADMQIKQEMQESTGRRLRKVTGTRRCRLCGNTGHNVRTCQTDAAPLSLLDNNQL